MTLLNDKQYDVAKWLVQILIPATASAYFAISELTGLPAGGTVAGVLAIIATFLGTILGISGRQYSANEATGVVRVSSDPGGVAAANIEVEGDPETALLENNILRLRIQRNEVSG